MTASARANALVAQSIRVIAVFVQQRSSLDSTIGHESRHIASASAGMLELRRVRSSVQS